MLSLKRRPGTSLVIDGPAVIHFKGHYQVVIDAPRDVRIVRKELLDREAELAAAVSISEETDANQG